MCAKAPKVQICLKTFVHDCGSLTNPASLSGLCTFKGTKSLCFLVKFQLATNSIQSVKLSSRQLLATFLSSSCICFTGRELTGQSPITLTSKSQARFKIIVDLTSFTFDLGVHCHKGKSME